METVEYKGIEIEIYQDDLSFDPRTDCSNLGVMVCRHGRYVLGDNDDINDSDCRSWSDVKDLILEKHKPIVILPLYLYDHSGITINTTGFGCDWDSMQVGWIYTTESLCDEFGINPEDIETISEYLVSEVEIYDDYITGNVYGFRIEDELVEDSCTGFYGYDHEKSGLLDEARAVIDRALSSLNKPA